MADSRQSLYYRPHYCPYCHTLLARAVENKQVSTVKAEIK